MNPIKVRMTRIQRLQSALETVHWATKSVRGECFCVDPPKGDEDIPRNHASYCPDYLHEVADRALATKGEYVKRFTGRPKGAL